MQNILAAAVALLEDENLAEEWQTIVSIFNRKEIRVAVFGPFNTGKSTLINALLGSTHLPFDLLPTTGVPIFVRYDKTLSTEVILVDGTRHQEEGCSLLQRFATRGQPYRIRKDVLSVEVRVPHPLLSAGLTIIDLPGTNDDGELEEIVRQELSYCDAVIQVWNAQQLNTLAEQKHLAEWITGAGISHVIFLLNFCNLLETEADCKAVMSRARLIINELSARLSPHSRLYRVDALPALQAQLQNKTSEVKRSGLSAFVNSLENLVKEMTRDPPSHRLPRIKAFAVKLLGILNERHEQQCAMLREKERQRRGNNRKREQSFDKLTRSFDEVEAEMRSAFNAVTLRSRYAQGLTDVLRQSNFENWKTKVLHPLQGASLSRWNDIVKQTCALIGEKPFTLTLAYPPQPQVKLPEQPTLPEVNGQVGMRAAQGAFVGTLITPGLGSLIGAILGGVAGKFEQWQGIDQKATGLAEYNKQVQLAYETAANDYLMKVSHAGQEFVDSARDKYRKLVLKPLPPAPEDVELTKRTRLLRQHIEKISTLKMQNGGK